MILLTGATGFLGGELLTRLLRAEENPSLCLLIRGENAEERFKELKNRLKTELPGLEIDSRLSFKGGDTTLPNFGLGESEFQDLANKTSKIMHSAASTNLGQSLELARSINVAGTENALKLAKRSSSFENFFHISTAYVAGDVTNSVRADEICLKRSFKNGYEQSKAEAEILVRGSGLNYCVYRPSVIAGDSDTGLTSSFNVLYVPVKFLVRGFFSALPLSTTAPFDVVPVNYVADSIVSLSGYSGRNRNGQIIPAATRQFQAYHLAAGVGRESNPWEIVEIVIKAFNNSRLAKFGSLHIPAVIQHEMLALIHHSICVARTGVKNLEKLFIKKIGVLSQALPFLPYMIRNPQFETTETQIDLNGILDPAPLFLNYAERLFLYCFESDWGRQTPENLHYNAVLAR